MPEEITLHGRKFRFIKIQRDELSAIYQSDNVFMRIGTKERILKDLKRHKEMFNIGFPLANIIEEGELEEKHYFLEESVGEKNFSTLFYESIESGLHPSDKVFQKFMDIVESFLYAQNKTKTESTFSEVRKEIEIDILCDELPEATEQVNNLFEKIITSLHTIPFVLSHGDFNPHNIHEHGVIDLEDSFHAPMGYDAVCAIEHIEFFPLEKEYEFRAKYRFSPEQKQEYYERIAKIYALQGIVFTKEQLEYLRFLRAVWSVVRMHKFPKLREWRFSKFKREFL